MPASSVECGGMLASVNSVNSVSEDAIYSQNNAHLDLKAPDWEALCYAAEK